MEPKQILPDASTSFLPQRPSQNPQIGKKENSESSISDTNKTKRKKKLTWRSYFQANILSSDECENSADQEINETSGSGVGKGSDEGEGECEMVDVVEINCK